MGVGNGAPCQQQAPPYLPQFFAGSGGGGGYFGGGGGGYVQSGAGGSGYADGSLTDVQSTSGAQTGNGVVTFSWSQLTSHVTLAAAPAAGSTEGQSVTLTATATGPAATPTGTVEFTADGAAISGCGAVTLVAGSASCTTSALAPGTDGLLASYSGDLSYAPASSAEVAYPVAYEPLVITTTSLPDGTAGTAYSATLSATGGLAPYTWSIDPTTPLPPGLRLSDDTLTGTPTASGTTTVTVDVRDAQSTPFTAHGSLRLVVGRPATSNPPLNKPIVGMAATRHGRGYRMAATDGGIFCFGDAQFHGSMGGHPLNEPEVGMAATPDGRGYWLVAADGGVFAFGDAPFYGSMGSRSLTHPVVGMAATPDGRGYWMVAADGGVFAFGEAPFYGSLAGRSLNRPIVGMAATPDGRGYWMVAADGGVFAFGDASFYGSMVGRTLNRPVVGMAASPDGHGYWLVAADGGVFAFGDAPFDGSMVGRTLNAPAVGMAADPGAATGWRPPTVASSPSAPPSSAGPSPMASMSRQRIRTTTTRPPRGGLHLEHLMMGVIA